MRFAAIAALLAILPAACGCGSMVAGAVWYFLPEEKDEEPATQPDAPVVIISTITGVHSADLDINYTITDRNSDIVNVVVEFSLDSGATYATAATESIDPRSEGTSWLTSSPTGINHLFVWDTLSDVGVGRVDTVRLRLTPSDSLTGTPAQTADFVVDNTPPTVQIKEFTGVQSGEVTVAYRILDGASDLTDIEVEFSTNGGISYWPATENAVSSFTEGTTDLASSPDGTLHIFVWDSIADCAGYRCEPEEPLVRIRITPSDLLPGLPVSTEDFALDNNLPPAVVLQTPVTPPPKKGNVTINYTLSDPEGDACSISVLYSITGGLTWGQAIRGSGGDPVTGLVSSATGVAHTYIWNSIANLGYCSEIQVLIAIIPRDFKEGTGGITGFFTVDNNLAPSASIVTPTEVQSGDVYILYYLFDGGGDTIEIQADYSPDGGGNWYAATLHASAPEGTTPLASAPTGYPHVFLWDSDNPADMQGQYSDAVIFRIKPTDEYANEGEYAVSGEFVISNNSPPSVSVASPPSSPSLTGDIVLDYMLYDDESQLCDVVVEYSTDGGDSWHLAAMASGSEAATARASLPGGVSHSFTWDSAADIDTLAEDVRIRMTPYDFPDRAGMPGTTTSFPVDNSHWSVPEQVTSTGSTSINPAVHAAQDGTVHLVWQENTFGNYSIYYSKKVGNSWSDPINISTAPRSCYYPDVVAGTNGTVHVAWFMADSGGDDQIHYRKYDGSKWLDKVQLTNSSSDVHLPSIAVDGANNPWVVFSMMYSGSYNIYCIRHDGTSWLAAEHVGYTGTGYEFPTIRPGPGGSTMHVSYRRNRNDPCRIYYTDHNGVDWLYPPETVYEFTGDYMLEPDLSIDSGGFVHIVWSRSGRAYYTTNASGSWSTPVEFSPSGVDRPQVVAHSPDYVHTVWCLNSQDIYYRRFDGVSWTTQEQVDLNSRSAQEPYMRRGLDGRIHLAYYEYDGSTNQIHYTSR